jgi:WD40 repeat protein
MTDRQAPRGRNSHRAKAPFSWTTLCASGTQQPVSCNGRCIHEVASAKEIKRITVADRGATSAAFSPDETRIVAVAGGAAKVFSVETEQQLTLLRGHQSPVRAAIFSPDGSLIATSSGQVNRPAEADASIRLWNAETGDAAGVMEGPRLSTNAIAFTSDGTRLVSGSSDGKARLWSVDVARSFAADLIKRARTAAPRCLTRAQRNKLFLADDPPTWCTQQKKWPYLGREGP